MLKYVLNIVIYLALALWIGSLVFFGAGVAALLFQPEMLPSRTLAGAVNSAILGRLGKIEIVAGVLLVGGTFYTAFRYRHLLNWIVLAISAAMLVTAAYYTTTLYPKMDALRVEIGDFDHVPSEKFALREEFDRGHETYSSLVKGVLGAGVLVLVLHTIAFVRYTEVHARRYRTLEGEWKKLKEKLLGKEPEPDAAASKPAVAEGEGIRDDSKGGDSKGDASKGDASKGEEKKESDPKKEEGKAVPAGSAEGDADNASDAGRNAPPAKKAVATEER